MFDFFNFFNNQQTYSNANDLAINNHSENEDSPMSNNMDEESVTQENENNIIQSNENESNDLVQEDNNLDSSTNTEDQSSNQNNSETRSNENSTRMPRPFFIIFSQVIDSNSGTNPNGTSNFGSPIIITVSGQDGSINDLDNLFTEIAMRLSFNETKKTHRANEEAIDSLATYVINENDNIQEEDSNNCIICFDSWQPGQSIIKMPCNHVYHSDCLLPWLKNSNTCPSCRYPLLTEDQEFNIQVEKEILSRKGIDFPSKTQLRCAMSPIGLCECNLNSFLHDEMVKLSCGHHFHPGCFETSLNSMQIKLNSNSAFKCPSCRKFSMIDNWEQYPISCFEGL